MWCDVMKKWRVKEVSEVLRQPITLDSICPICSAVESTCFSGLALCDKEQHLQVVTKTIRIMCHQVNFNLCRTVNQCNLLLTLPCRTAISELCLRESKCNLQLFQQRLNYYKSTAYYAALPLTQFTAKAIPFYYIFKCIGEFIMCKPILHIDALHWFSPLQFIHTL